MQVLLSYKIGVIVLLFSAFGSCITQDKKANADMPVYLNPGSPVTNRVEDLLKRMTLKEKVAQMCQFVGLEHIKASKKEIDASELLNNDAKGFYPGLSISEIEQMVVDGEIGSFLHVTDYNEANYLQQLAQKSRLKIPLLIGIDAIHGTAMVNGATVYPTPIGLASTWDTELIRKIGSETAAEMRASGSAWTFTPNIDVARDPRWGRVGETFGEDPVLVAEMGRAMIKGLQNDTENAVLACAKHLIAGSESVNGINGAPTDLSERTIRDIFLPPYKAAVDAEVYTIMTAHNELNGIPCHSDKWMMTEILRNEMGFKGFYVSDWMDIERLVSKHHTAKDQTEACYQTIDAGMDMHMHGPGFLHPVMELVREGKISEERIDESVRKILKAKFQLGLFENPFVNDSVFKETLFKKPHRETALEAAQKSVVLLKNKNQLLPLKKSANKTILVTGVNADNQSILGDWSARQPDSLVTTVLEGIKLINGNKGIQYLNIGDHPRYITEKHLSEARHAAGKADMAIIVAGSNAMRWKWGEKTSGENAARSEITLPGRQEELIKAISESGIPVILVLVNGRPLSTESISENVDAIIESWEPGSFGGLAIAQIIYGDVNPSGKLPLTIPRSSGHLLAVYNHKPTHYFHEYVTTNTKPLYEFGYGLTYTNFNYENLRLSKQTISKKESLILKAEVKNTGNRKGEEIVQLYIRDLVSSVTRPVKQLAAFKRVSLDAGETYQVSFEITPEMLQFTGKDMKHVIESGEFSAMIGGSSRDTDLLCIPFFVK